MLAILSVTLLSLIAFLFGAPHLLLFIRRKIASRSIPLKKHILSDDIILITGGANGIGRCLAQKLLPCTKSVIVWDCDEHALQTLSSESLHLADSVVISKFSRTVNETGSYEYHCNIKYDEKTQHNLVIMPVDVTNLDQCHCAYQTLIAYYQSSSSPVTVLINNAGIAMPVSLTQNVRSVQHPASSVSTSSHPRTTPSHDGAPHHPSSDEIYGTVRSYMNRVAYTHQVNAFAPMQLAHYLLLHRLRGHSEVQTTSGSRSKQGENDGQTHHCPLQMPLPEYPASTPLQIITIASAAAMSYSYQLSAYCGSKASIVAMLRSLRYEHQRLSLTRSTALHPQDQTDQCPEQALPPGRWTTLLRAVLNQWLLVPIFQGSQPPEPSAAPSDSLSEPLHVHWLTVLPWHVRTRMFEYISTLPLVKWFVPSLDADYVADTVIDHISTKRFDSMHFGAHSSYRERILPSLLCVTPILSMLPIWVSDLLTGVAGGWNAMDTHRDYTQSLFKVEKTE